MRIFPDKHEHPSCTIVYVSYLILKKIKKERLVAYETLHDLIKNEVRGGSELLLPALNFLYLLGLVKYHLKIDSFEYVEKDEAFSSIH